MIFLGLIYKYTNKITGLSYIGQTRLTFKERLQYHLSGTQYIDNIIRKYGLENFELSILEDNLSEEELDDRECYYIKKYDTYNNGYNLTTGGKPSQYYTKYSDEFCQSIIDTILSSTLTFQEIAQQYNVKISLISDLNRGRRKLKNNNYTYPLRKTTTKTALTQELILTIIDKLKNENDKSADQIGDELGISGFTVGNINRGKAACCRTLNESFPIRKHLYRNKENAGKNFAKISVEQLWEIVELLLSTDLSLEEISQRYNVTKLSIDRINQIKTW